MAKQKQSGALHPQAQTSTALPGVLNGGDESAAPKSLGGKLPGGDAKPKNRSRRGSGSVFQKPNSKHWVIQYYRYDHVKQKSVRVREYTQLSTRMSAQKLLTDRLSKVGRGEQFEIGRPITVAELYDALRTFTDNNGAGVR